MSGDEVRYRLRVTNNGGSEADGTIVRDTFDTSFRPAGRVRGDDCLSSVTITPNALWTTNGWTIHNLAGGGTTCSIIVT